MSDLSPEDVAFLARIDQQKAGATELAGIVATQWVIYRAAEMPKSIAGSLVEMWLEAVLAVTEVEE